MEIDLPSQESIESETLLEKHIETKPSSFDFDATEVDVDEPVFLKTQTLKTYSKIKETRATDLTFEEFQQFSDFAYMSQSKEENIQISNNDALMKEISNLRLRIQKLKIQNLKLKDKIKNPDLSIIDSLRHVSPQAKSFCKMLLTEKNCYSEDQRQLACNLHFKSTANYKFMRNQLGFHLPSLKSIYNYFPVKSLQPGFNLKLNQNLKKLTKKMKRKDRFAVLMFDEISIRRDLDFNEKLDLIDGFQHLSEEERKNLIGKSVCVFMLRGLFSNWKYVLNYFVTEKGMTGNTLKKIIQQNVKIIKELGLRTKALVCDQGGGNTKVFKLFGVTPEKPFTTIDGEKIYFLYDVPHLIKSVRNNLLDKPYLKTPDGKARWAHIKRIFNEDEKSGLLRRCPRLTESHVMPNNFEKMKVRFATQILSKTVAAALKDLTSQNIIDDENKATYNFVLNMNNVFDILNIKKYGNGLKPGGSLNLILKHLQKYISFVSENNSQKILCFYGLCQTIEAVLGLINDFSEDPEFSEQQILTSRLNQDPLENFFSQVRSRGGCGTNPSVSQLNSTIAKIVSMRILSFDFETKNCETDNDLMLEYIRESLNAEENDPQQELVISEVLESVDEVPNEDEFVEEIISPKHKSSFEGIQRYILGFSIFRKVKCLNCSSIMKKIGYNDFEQSEVFIREKDFSSSLDEPFLTNPSDYFLSVFKVQFDAFRRFFPQNIYKLKLKSTLLDKCMEATSEKFPEWFAQNSPCFDHRKQILDYILKVLIKRNAKWRVKNSVKSAKHLTRIRHLRE